MVIVQETKVYMFICLRSGDFDDFEVILKLFDYSCFQEGMGLGGLWRDSESLLTFLQ